MAFFFATHEHTSICSLLGLPHFFLAAAQRERVTRLHEVPYGVVGLMTVCRTHTDWSRLSTMTKGESHCHARARRRA